jgi:predicted aspartyl protease
MSKPFTAFTLEHKARVNVLKTEVIVSSITTINPNGGTRKYIAVWDTGATNTVISQRVATNFNLIPTGKIPVSTASGKTISNQYLVSMILPNKLNVPDILVTEGDLGDNFDVLIGMDIIGCGDFSVTNVDNKTVFSFRYPSCETIDYCKEARKIKNKEIEKAQKELERKIKQHGNDKCPCGSGKKYRYCHGIEEMKEIKKNKETVKS